MKYSILFAIVIFFSSCDSYEEAGITNNTPRQIEFITIGSPATINGDAVFTQQVNDRFFYELVSNSRSSIIQLVNDEIKPLTIPFDTLIIIDQLDTLSINGNTEIFGAMKETIEGYQYEIEID